MLMAFFFTKMYDYKQEDRVLNVGRDSSVDTGWTVRGIESPREQDFSAPVQTGPGAHPASCTMGTLSFLEVMLLEPCLNHPSV